MTVDAVLPSPAAKSHSARSLAADSPSSKSLLSKSLSSPSLSSRSLSSRSLSGDDLTHSIPGAASAQSAKGPLSVPSQPRIGVPRSLQRWERYQVISVLGAGGMGAVYKVRDPRLNRFVALKIVHPMLGHDQNSTGDFFVKRFVREARIQASLDHLHICKVYEIGELPGHDGESGYPYIAMQLINGKPLNVARLEMSLFEKVRVIQQVAEALHAAHRQGADPS